MADRVYIAGMQLRKRSHLRAVPYGHLVDHPRCRPGPFGLAVVSIVVAALVGACTASADREQMRPVDDVVATRLQAALEDAIAAEEDATSAVVAIDVAGRVWIGRAGPSGTRESVDTSFLLASVTKTYVAALTLELVDEGRLGLDEATQLDGIPEATTVRQLLNHTSGLPSESAADDRSTPAAFAVAVGQGPPPLCAPGSCHHYSDLNYLALGLVLEARTGSTVDELVDRFLDGHGLAHTVYAADDELPADMHLDYDASDIADRDGAALFARRTGAGGAMVATASDLLRFGRLLFAGDMLSGALLREMLDPTPMMALPCLPDDCVGRYGLGVEIARMHGRPAYGHEGSTGAFLAHLPDEDVTIAVLTDGPGAGRRIASRMTEAAGIDDHADIWTMDLRGEHLTRLTDTAGIDGGPAWSPDGGSIVFGSTRGGRPELYVMDADGTNQRRLTTDPANHGAGRYSPDGSRIVFASDRSGNADIWTVAADGTDPQQLTSSPEDERLASYAPDGRIVFEIGPDGDRDLVVMDGDGAEPTRFHLPGDQSYGSWSATGDRIAYRHADEGIWTINADGTDARPVPGTHPGDRFPAWGPDGTLAYVDRAGDLWTTRPDGTDRRRLSLTDEEEFGPWWSPDGRTLVFPSDRGPTPGPGGRPAS